MEGYLPEREAIKIGLAVNWEPFGKLIENPRDGKPDFADNRCKPEANSVMHRVQNSVSKKDSEYNKAGNDDHSVRVDLARCNGYFS